MKQKKKVKKLIVTVQGIANVVYPYIMVHKWLNLKSCTMYRFQVSVANLNGHIKKTRMLKNERVGLQFNLFQL
jgi:elongation factor P hydroxylase